MSRRLIPVVVVLALLPTLTLPGTAHAKGGDAYAAVTIMDPAGRHVGAAGALCGLRDAASMATIAPGHGAVVAEPPRPGPANASLLQLQAGATADALVTEAPSSERGSSAAAVTLDSEPAARADAPFAASGNGDVSAVVIAELPNDDMTNAIAAADAEGNLADRLLDTLRILWSPGICEGKPSDAFLIVAGPADASLVPARGLPAARHRVMRALDRLGGTLAADELADRLLDAAAIPHPTGADAPEVYLSLLQPPGGFDAVQLLRQAYAQIATTPTPAISTPTAERTLDPVRSDTVDSGLPYVAVVLIAIGFIVALAAIARRLRTMRDD